MMEMLESFGMSPTNVNSPHHKTLVKRNLVDLARDWPCYYARLFPVTGGKHHQDVQLLAVSHTGIRLVKKDKNNSGEHLLVLDTFVWDDVTEAAVPKHTLLHILLRNGQRVALYTPRAQQIRTMIENYAADADSGSHSYVKAVTNYNPRDPTLLNFQKGDIIRVVREGQFPEKGLMYGAVNGRSGLFPSDYVAQISPTEAIRRSQDLQEINGDNLHNGHSEILSHSARQDVWALEERNNKEEESDLQTTTSNDGKYSMLQFAMLHFRNGEKFEMIRNQDGTLSDSLKAIEMKKKKGKKGKDDWTWKEQVDLIKFTSNPLKNSLIKLEGNDVNKLAVECFVAIMRYMADVPMPKDKSEIDCVYTLLMHCHNHEQLRDEVMCQIMKQTTNNKSANSDSCQRGWRLFSILVAYFTCSETLSPYLFKYLETAAYDKRRAYHGTALVCLQNLRKTIKYGGRKNVPSIEEITAITAGRNSKRQIYRLPGGTEKVINTKSTSVVQDIIEEICSIINVRDNEEMEEFSIYCIVEGDTFTIPVARNEYILDLTTELQKNNQVFYLIFCRSVWLYPLRLDNQLYIEVVFNQIAPDYIEGLMLVMPGGKIEQNIVYDIAKVAALIHRTVDLEHMPTIKETKCLLPRPALTVRDIRAPQWVNMVQAAWKDVENLKAIQAKAQVLEILQKWPLFGSSFFVVTLIQGEEQESMEHLLALNRNGVHFLDSDTHETMLMYPFSEVLSARKVKSSQDGTLFLDMKCGNLMQHKMTRIKTDQAHEISRVIGQYISIVRRNKELINSNEETQSKSGSLSR